MSSHSPQDPIVPARSPRRIRSAHVALTGLTAIALAVGGIGGATVASAAPPSPALSVDEVLVDAGASSIAWPAGVEVAGFEVEGVAGAAGSTGDPAARPMASIAKLLFAIVLLDEHPLAAGEQGPSIVLDDGDVAHLTAGLRDGATVLPVAAGDVLTQRQLLEAAMLMSASNATMTLADWGFGSHDAYLAAAERWLTEHGIEGVTVTDASGLSDRGVATTQGLLELMDEVDARPALREITGMTSATLPRVGEVTNSNEALGSAGVDSGKTGSLNAHGRTVLVGATRVVDGTPVRIRVALLGIQSGVDRGAVTAALVDSVAANLEWLSVLPGDTAVAQYDVPWADPIVLETTAPVSVLHWRGTPVRVSVDAPAEWTPDAPASLAVEIGSSVRSVPLVSTGSPPEPSFEWRLQHAADLLAQVT